jgi:hypothetical protein
VVGIELDRPLQTLDRLVPLLHLDGESAEEEMRLGEVGVLGQQTLEHRSRTVVGLLLDLESGQHQVRVGGSRVVLDHLLELGLRLHELLLAPQELGQHQPRRGTIRRELDGLARGGQRLVGVVQLLEPLCELHPERRRAGIAPQRLAQLADGLAESPGLRVCVRHQEVRPGVGGRVVDPTSGDRDRPWGLRVAGGRRRRGGTPRERKKEDEERGLVRHLYITSVQQWGERRRSAGRKSGAI